jgi:CheY-like chemotaxis protein
MRWGVAKMNKPIHVLVVEDSIIAQKVVQLNLAHKGCIVDIATNAQEALQKTDDYQYDLILMDIRLDNKDKQGLKDGFDIAMKIKLNSAKNRNTSIAALSAYEEQEYMEKAESAGMVGYFNKPFTNKYADKVIHFIKNNLLIRMINHMR